MISPTLAIRAGGLFQDADVAGRNYTTDDRDGGFVALKWKPIDAVKITADYVHTDLHGIAGFRRAVLPAEHLAYAPAGGPFPDFGVNRNNFYGFVNRDFFQVQQDIGTINTEVQVTPDLVISDKMRASRSVAELHRHDSGIADLTKPLSASTLSANPQSRYQPTDVVANQTEATYKFDTGRLATHRARGCRNLARNLQHRQIYRVEFGSCCRRAFSGSGSLTGVSVFNPQYTFVPFSTTPTLTGLPTKIGIDTKSGYLLDSANYHDLVILNGGIRYDDYNINTSAVTAR